MLGQGDIHINMHKDFLSRIKLVLSGRKLFPWGASIGLGRGVMSGINEGRTPVADSLSVISRAENVRIDWLLLGKGTPFFVNHCASDQECADLVGDFMDEQWSVYLVTDGRCIALVLSQPGQYQIGERWIDYTIIEVIAGAIGEATYERLRSCLGPDNYIPKSGDLHLVETDRERFSELASGKIGTWVIATSPNSILSRARAIAIDDLPESKAVAEEQGEFKSEKEKELLQTFRQLSNSDMDKALQIISVLKIS